MIKVKNWASYQSYKDRRPPWIRFHRTMLDNFQYQSMTAESRALLPMLWLLACEDKDPTSGLIRLSLDEISFRLRLHVKTLSKCIEELQAADFIECIESVTKPLLNSNQSVTTETETETEKRRDRGEDIITDEDKEKEFELVWDMYGKKGNRKTSLAKFKRMKDSEKKLMAEHLPRYIESTPDIQFRKGLQSYIEKECWNDEIIQTNKSFNGKTSDNFQACEDFING